MRQSTSLNLDTDRPSVQGLDESNRGNVDSAQTKFEDDLPLQPPNKTVTYDELRQKNREDYQKRNTGMYGQPLPPQQRENYPPITRAPPPKSDEQMQSGVKNKYGDSWSG